MEDVKWNKPDIRGKVLYDSTYVMPGAVKFIEKNVGWQGLGHEQVGSCGLMGTEFKFCNVKRVLWVDGADGWTMWMCLTPLNCRLDNAYSGRFHVTLYFTLLKTL